MSRRDYPDRPWIGIGVIVFRATEVLLVRRGKPPRQGSWSLPGGAQGLGERAEAAARRELREETGVEVGPLSLADVIDALTHDAAGRVQFHYTIVDYWAEWRSGEARAGDDVEAVAWAPLDALEPYGLTEEARRVIALAARGRG
ncbi:MAG: NUDIX domain-containing protein [Rubritepida sp.]|nr:NUDIX domain-containing protein [Rubritepida sp.]MCU0944949.1 NUDIX domain-containing protein [Rubritepida sp.]